MLMHSSLAGSGDGGSRGFVVNQTVTTQHSKELLDADASLGVA
jgi:hypothetical protein